LAVRELRKNQTEAEELLWSKLRNRGFLGKKFLRQHPLCFTIEGGKRFFIADFYCREKRLVIEIDGKIHLKQKEYDRYREMIIQCLGLLMIRVTNEIIVSDLDGFLHDILMPILTE